MHMRPSRVLKKLRDGKLVACTKLNLGDPRAAELAAMCGFDCIWLDMEHVPTDWQTIENQIRAAKVHNVDTIVRVAKGAYSDLIQPLEADATGIMVPHLMSAEEAKKIVWHTRFHPLGRRPIDGGNIDGSFCMIDQHEYMADANKERFVVVQIEDPEPLDELEAIAQIKGIDMLFFGPNDFSQGIGAPAKWDDKRIIQARQRIAQTAIDNGKFAGTTSSPEDLQKYYDLGYQFVNVGADVVAMVQYFTKIMELFNKLNNH